MRGGAGGALWLLLLLVTRACGTGGEGGAGGGEEPDDEDESDSAPFTVVVERGDGRRCSASLVSLRTVVTAASCVRRTVMGATGAASGALWALSAPALAAVAGDVVARRRVVRVAEGRGGGALDMALLEMEAPFGAEAEARPIMMATEPGECGAPALKCHAVRVLWRSAGTSGGSGVRGGGGSGGGATQLRIVDPQLEQGEGCTTRDRALCLSGPEMCPSDVGAGVVCGGKLCGVLVRSMRDNRGEADPEPEEPSGGAEDPPPPAACGDLHRAARLPRFRHFLHCAHTQRDCGRGDCVEVCSQRRLPLSGEEEELSVTPTPTSPPTLPLLPIRVEASSPRHRLLDVSEEEAPPEEVTGDPGIGSGTGTIPGTSRTRFTPVMAHSSRPIAHLTRLRLTPLPGVATGPRGRFPSRHEPRLEPRRAGYRLTRTTLLQVLVMTAPNEEVTDYVWNPPGYQSAPPHTELEREPDHEPNREPDREPDHEPERDPQLDRDPYDQGMPFDDGRGQRPMEAGQGERQVAAEPSRGAEDARPSGQLSYTEATPDSRLAVDDRAEGDGDGFRQGAIADDLSPLHLQEQQLALDTVTGSLLSSTLFSPDMPAASTERFPPSPPDEAATATAGAATTAVATRVVLRESKAREMRSRLRRARAAASPWPSPPSRAHTLALILCLAIIY